MADDYPVLDGNGATVIAERYDPRLGGQLADDPGMLAVADTWTLGTGWVQVDGGGAEHTGGAASYLSQDAIEPSTEYEVEIEVLVAGGSNFAQLYLVTSPSLLTMALPGVYKVRATSQASGSLGFAIRGVGTVRVRRASIKKVVAS